MLNKVIFLDRDGVINVKAPPHEYIKSWEEFQFLPDVAQAIEMFNHAGYLVILISNQRGIARGCMTLNDVNRIHENMRKALKSQGAIIHAIFICPHDKNSCECRKPKIGMFLQAEKKYAIDKRKSFMVGDSESDIQAGKNYGIKTIAINKNGFNADYRCESLLEAAKYIIEVENK